MRVTAVTTAVPHPRKPRLLGFVRALRLAGHDVSIVATTDLSRGGGGSTDDGASKHLAELGVAVFEVQFDPSRRHLARAGMRVAARRSSSETALYDSRRLADRVAIAIRTTEADVLHVDRVRALSLTRGVTVPLVVDITDPRLGTYRHYRRSVNLRPPLVGLTETIRAALDQAPATREEVAGLVGVPALVASELGRHDLLDAGADPATLWTVPNAVFPDERVEPRQAQAMESVVVGMSGNFSYPPNVLAFERLANEILPSIQRAIGVRLVVVGAAPHPLVVKRAKMIGAELHPDVASVPDTLRELGVAVMLSPQNVSTGFPNRVVDAVYRAGVPIVSSPETLSGAPPELAAQLPVADAASEWPERIRHLMRAESGDELVLTLQDVIEEVCGPQRVADLLVTAYRHAMANRPPRRRV